MRVWVVLGKTLEDTFLSGVFETEQEAQSAVKIATESWRAYDFWHNCWYEESKRLRRAAGLGSYFPFKLSEENRLRWDQLGEDAAATIGPKPPFERTKDFEIECVETGAWKHE